MKQYKTIYADPPWQYKQTSKSKGSRLGAEKHYLTMSYDELKELPIPQIAYPDCILWLWATNSHIHEALHLIEHWEFTYKTMATWVKNRMGMGYWLRGKTEHLLVAIKGNPDRTNFHNLSYTTELRGKVTNHSKKPIDAYGLIENLSPKPWIELFARSLSPMFPKRLGWDVWGDEIKSDINLTIK